MKLFRKLAMLGAAAEAARRYAQKNPEKARQLADKAAEFANQRTKGKYHDQIESVKQKLAEVGGFATQGQRPAPGTASGATPGTAPGTNSAPTPRPASGPSQQSTSGSTPPSPTPRS